jgi:6,7-dimethyl-8-ribityllumazine synthase
MATGLFDFKSFNNDIPSAKNMRFGIVVATWNSDITERLLEGAVAGLLKAGCLESNIAVKHVPGTVELTLGAQFFAEYTDVDAVIVLGCVIQGDTRHFDFVCQSVTQGITQLMISWNMPIAFGVLTTDNMQQALDRAGGCLGNKGQEAAATAIQMVALQNEMDMAAEDNGVKREAPATTETPATPRSNGGNNKVN